MWFGEPHPFPGRGPPTRLSNVGTIQLKRRSGKMCTELLPPGGYPIAVKYIWYRIKNVCNINDGEIHLDKHCCGSIAVTLCQEWSQNSATLLMCVLADSW
jgi:hypothetical protein